LFTSKLALGQVDECWLVLSQGFTGSVGEDDHHSLTHCGGVSAPPRINHSSRNVRPVALEETTPSRLCDLPFAASLF